MRMQFLQFSHNTRSSTRTCALVLLFLICINVQFCQAYWWWWWWWSWSPTPADDMETEVSPSEQYSTPEECARQCQDGEPPKKCYYRFIIEYYMTNSKACDFCQLPVNDSRINSTCQCIISDGVEKTVFSINRMIPGPSIQVCKGDTIIIDVVNEAEGIEVTIHWHGVFQKNYQYYDGVPHVTQCPILSGNTFRYTFGADNSGTHFYHSHIAAQIIDGEYGSLIIRDSPSNNSHSGSYNEDRPEHVMVISDMFHELTLERYPGRYRSNRGQVAQNFLINGRGDWTDPTTGRSNNISLSTFMVERGKRYRFRVINACGTVCPIMLSIENHSMEIIALDGEDVNPISANAANMASGERLDFVLFANQSPGSYWIFVKGLGECKPVSVHQLAILAYQGISESPLSPKPRYSDLSENVDRTFNPLNSTNCDDDLCVHKTCVHKKNMSNKDYVLLNAKADITLNLSFEFFNYSSSLQNLYRLFNTNSPDYKKFFVAIEASHLISKVNNYSYVDSPKPLILEKNYQLLCGNSYTPSTCTEPCVCTHVYHIKLGALVDVMLYDKGPLSELNHPFHLHGYSFCVMYSGQFRTNKDYITDKDVEYEMKAHNRRLQDGYYKCCSPKDTIIVPNTGFVILRFFADNPGWWYFHCHFSWHTISGMNVVLHVGTPNDLPPVPKRFPKCYNWT